MVQAIKLEEVWLPMSTFLTKTTTLWMTFFATIFMTLGFGLVMYIWQFVIIDEMYAPEQISAHVGAMTSTQKTVHAWMTATLDVAYPLAYGGFFIGMALRFFGQFGPWLAAPSFAVIPVDLAEGLVQILVLNGNEGVIWYKMIITPLKLGLFLIGLSVAVIGICIALRQLIRRNSDLAIDG